MACCNDQPPQNINVSFADLPDDAYCCMARVAYECARVCLQDPCPDWYSLTEDRRTAYGDMARAAAVNRTQGETPLDAAMTRVIGVLTATS